MNVSLFIWGLFVYVAMIRKFLSAAEFLICNIYGNLVYNTGICNYGQQSSHYLPCQKLDFHEVQTSIPKYLIISSLVLFSVIRVAFS